MAECFCGCGRKVKLGSRGINRNGAATASLVAQLEATEEALIERGPLKPGGDAGPMIEAHRERISEGMVFSSVWAQAVHGNGLEIPPREALDFKRRWNAWGKSARKYDGVVRGTLSMPPDQLDQFLGELFADE
jgi:hypothetical protein